MTSWRNEDAQKKFSVIDAQHSMRIILAKQKLLSHLAIRNR